MKLVKLDFRKEYNLNKKKFLFKLKTLFNNNIILLLFFINIIITAYLFIENRNQKRIIKEILNSKNSFYYKNKNMKNNYPYNNKEMIGLNYPDIDYDKIKDKLKNINIIDSLVDLINQLEIKLIYLEKEINITKIISFYNSRKYYLREHKIKYNEKNITQLHEIINWIIIHQSNQLKGIASDKYLVCKYVKIKLGINLCQQRIAIYDNINELNYKELLKYGNIVLKVSNSCWKTVIINNNETLDSFNEKINKFKQLYNYDHGVVNMQPFHLYPKKRIIVEKQLTPLTELYEFKYFVINRDIKFIYLQYYINTTNTVYLIYDKNYNFIFRNNMYKVNPLNIKAMFKKDILEKMKIYANNLSEDFPNFIRVDLYLFHNNIYLSELTFASYDGLYLDKNETYIIDAVKNFTRFDNYY